jgi:hypothetical protein
LIRSLYSPAQAVAVDNAEHLTVAEPTPYQFRAAMEALLRAHAKLLIEDKDIEKDERLLHDMLEGDADTGNAMDVLHGVLRAALAAEDLETLARARAQQTQDRAKRFEKRATTLRAAAFEAMQALGLPRIKLPELTASIRKGGAAGVVITDETKLNDKYIRVKKEPSLAVIRADLLANIEVEGAVLGNPAPFIVITTN